MVKSNSRKRNPYKYYKEDGWNGRSKWRHTTYRMIM